MHGRVIQLILSVYTHTYIHMNTLMCHAYKYLLVYFKISITLSKRLTRIIAINEKSNQNNCTTTKSTNNKMTRTQTQTT